MKNRTKYRTLDKLESDARIAMIWSEEGTDDGLWISLEAGFNLDGCGVVHEYSVKDLLASLKWVKAGPTY